MEKVILIRNGEKRSFPPKTAEYAKQYGWIEFTPPPVHEAESLTDLKARIKAMQTVEEVNQALYLEQQREAPRASVINLCNELIAKWN